MKIGYLTSQYPATSHTFIRREVAALRERGFDIHTFSIRRPAPEERNSKLDQPEYENTWYVFPLSYRFVIAHLFAFLRRPITYFSVLGTAFSHRVPGIKAFLQSVAYFGEAIYLADELKTQQIDHLHNHFANPSANVGFLSSHYLGITWSLTIHGASDSDYPSSFLLPSKVHHAQFVACVCHFTMAQAMRRLEPALWMKLFISRCGLDLSQFKASDKNKSIGSKIRVICIARLSPEKGITGLIYAFSKVIENGIDAQLRILGEGIDRSRIENAIRSLSLENHCQLPGRISEQEIVGELTNADILVLPSFMEGLPVVLMEALACRVPVIAPNVGGVSELVNDRISGLLFSPGNWSQLADNLLELSKNPELRKQLANQGAQRVTEEFDIKLAVNPLAGKFLELQQ